jgi:hypothetical protein
MQICKMIKHSHHVRGFIHLGFAHSWRDCNSPYSLWCRYLVHGQVCLGVCNNMIICERLHLPTSLIQ